MQKIIYIALLSVLVGLYTFPGQAQVFVRTEVVSGKLLVVNVDNSIILDNKITYFPSRKSLRVGVKPGTVVTIRYAMQGGRRIFSELALGRNSLQPSPASPTHPKNRRKF